MLRQLRQLASKSEIMTGTDRGHLSQLVTQMVVEKALRDSVVMKTFLGGFEQISQRANAETISESILLKIM